MPDTVRVSGILIPATAIAFPGPNKFGTPEFIRVEVGCSLRHKGDSPP